MNMMERVMELVNSHCEIYVANELMVKNGDASAWSGEKFSVGDTVYEFANSNALKYKDLLEMDTYDVCELGDIERDMLA